VSPAVADPSSVDDFTSVRLGPAVAETTAVEALDTGFTACAGAVAVAVAVLLMLPASKSACVAV
ncbi:hypothetical protein SB767_31455, partial [Bacillus sp. SIMBA_069]